MSRPASDRWVPAATALALGLLLLGPALGPGVVIAYDMPWSPDPRFTPFVLGVGTPAPRAVPSDAAGVALGHLVGAGLAQKVILLGILVLAGVGCARLLAHLRPDAGATARCAAVALAEWNAFVGERLVAGQWTVLLAYAVLPWAFRAALSARTRPDWQQAATLAGWVALSGAGGANTVVVVAGAVLLVLLAPGSAVRPTAAVVVTAAGVSAAWALPAVLAGAGTGSAGIRAFAPRSDMPLGVVASLVSGGGFWNPASHPGERGTLVLAVIATAFAVSCVAAVAAATHRPGAGRSLWVPALIGLLLSLVAAAPWLDAAWTALLTDVPGAALLRDTQKVLAPWVVLTAVGAGVLADDLRWRLPAPGRIAAVTLVALPVVLLPGLAWGRLGRLDAVAVPAEYRAAATALSAAPAGQVGLLPWNQYRRYAWNGHRVSLTLLPRIVDQQVLYDDALPLRDGVVPGEDPRAAAVTRAVAAGRTPIDALREQGVRYIAFERRTGLPEPEVRGAGQVLSEGPDLVVVRLDGPAAAPVPPTAALRVGWGVSLLTEVLAAGAVGLVVSRRRRQ